MRLSLCLIFGELAVIKKILKISFFVILLLASNFVSFGFGRLTKKNELYDKCMQYHAALTKQDADFTCTGIMSGTRWDVEVLVPGVHGDPFEDVTKNVKKDSR